MGVLDHTFQFIGAIAALVVFFRVEPVLNIMSRKCRLSIRVAYWALAGGAATSLWWILRGDVPTLPWVVVLVGAACLTSSDRRVRGVVK